MLTVLTREESRNHTWEQMPFIKGVHFPHSVYHYQQGGKIVYSAVTLSKRYLKGKHSKG